MAFCYGIVVAARPNLNLTKPNVGVTWYWLWKGDHHLNHTMSCTAGLVPKKGEVETS